VLDDGDLRIPHRGLGGDVLRCGGEVRRFDDQRARAGVGAVCRQIAYGPTVGAEDQQQSDHDREGDVAHAEREHVEGGPQQRQVGELRYEEPPVALRRAPQCHVSLVPGGVGVSPEGSRSGLRPAVT